MGTCLKFLRQGQFHPLKYLDGLAKVIQKNGGVIYKNSLVQNLQEKKAGVKVKLENGCTVKAGLAVMATNAPFADGSSLMYAKQAPYRTYAIAVALPKNTVKPGLYWDTEAPYHYTRLVGNFLMVGGEDHKTGQPHTAEDPFARLYRWTRQNFPMVKKGIKYQWSGQIMEPIDGLAYIGVNPGNKRIYVATGYSGSGMTYSAISAQIIGDLILGKKNRWAKLYDPARANLRAAGRFVRENLNVAVEYFEDLAPKKNTAVRELQKGMGMVVSDGLKKTAVYRDKKGKICKFSAVCPHLGCFVHWNKVENSWDCPCHGSRFDLHGKVLNGPAKKHLKRVS